MEIGDEFEPEFFELHEEVRTEILALARLLQQFGPQLGRPRVDTLNGSRHTNMKELRSGTIRVLFVFDPNSNAVLLLGGDKRGDWTGWYEENIPKADQLYDNYLNETKE